MDRLISLEPSNIVTIRVESAGQKCYGELTLRNVMYTMPVAFRIQPMNKNRYTIRPQSGIISPLMTLTVEIVYHIPPNSSSSFLLPDDQNFPYSDDSFLLHSVVAPGASFKDPSSAYDAVPNDWFTTKKKQVFIDSGIKIMFVGSLVLSQLVGKGSMDEIREALEKSDPRWKAADSLDSDGQTLLHLAISRSRPDLVQLLLEFNPDIEAPSRFSGSTPLEAAAASGEALIVELLLARGARLGRSESSARGPIHLAAGGGHVEVLRLLLLKGADVDSLTKDGNTALHVAVEERRKDCAKLLLLSNGSCRAANVRNGSDGDTPLHIAAGLGDEQLVKLLLSKGANKDIRNRVGKTAYDVAAENGNSKLFDALRLGDNLCAAARKGEVRTIHRLLETGANINGRDQNGWTALHRASFKGKIDAVRTLIENGIDVSARDEDGFTALHCAVESGHVEVIELLMKKGAEIEARTNKGVTPLQIADSLNYSGITRILLSGGATPRTAAAAAEGGTKIAGYLMPLSSRKEMEVGKIKKKSNRSRIRRSSFDRSVPLTVV